MPRILNILALLAVLVTAFASLKLSSHYYAKFIEVRLDPAHRKLFAGDNARLLSIEQPHKRIVFIGDSRIEQWSALTKSTGFNIIKRGIGGDTSAQTLLRIEQDAISLAPKAILIEIGINDLTAIGLFPDRQNQIIEQLKENIHLIIKNITDNHIPVYLMTIFPTSQPGLMRQLIWYDDINKSVSLMNEFIRSLASDQVIIVDTTLLNSATGSMRSEYARDTLHINDDGYSVLNKILNRVLATTPPLTLNPQH